ncbi:peroxidase-related enzyme [Acuticoccus sp. MNP-M23]|uniref:peroxidase-related enzyme n=1 Tax=Acuticoccus sp. MNP-M23 TaxID=3072793 RepID=UPI00281619A2|nr:peroxidase-related enzyme [Acuticoccus sp. MNP-M23]WMS43073.1 peroxidase-related enzyme [Acuticoccus sp. MNP-M23]
MENEEAVISLDLPPQTPLSEETEAYFAKCQDKLGLVPNVLRAYSFDENKLRKFTDFYNEVMLAESDLSKLEREMIAVVVSAANRCHYCLIAHGATVRALSGDAALGDTLAANYRAASLSARHRAMLDYAWTLTTAPHDCGPAEEASLREAGFGDRAIWDIVAVTGFFNMTNRVASATKMRPNAQYYAMGRKS